MTLDTQDPFAPLRHQIAPVRRGGPVGRISRLDASGFGVEGLSRHARLGDDLVYLDDRGVRHRAEVVRLEQGMLWAVPFGVPEGLRIGLIVETSGPPSIGPDDSWIGRIVDPFGMPIDDRHLLRGAERSLTAAPPAATRRRAMGRRQRTGYAVLDTMLPIARGQRIGLFAGSGVGKSTLLGKLACEMEADVCVLALVGERGREVSDFVHRVLGPEGMARTVVVAATSDMSAGLRRRSGATALSVAEHFRDQGKQVLLLFDSVTRLAEAHREIACAGGEGGDLRGFPPSLVPLLAGLAERAGPGADGQGDITAVFTVLVAGSDLEEPVADIVRGQLDGHVVLSRDIAEAGRFPAIDVLRSVSRSLPGVATAEENALIGEARRVLGTRDRSHLMVSSGLYERGSSADIDRSMMIGPRLDRIFEMSGVETPHLSFKALADALGLPFKADL